MCNTDVFILLLMMAVKVRAECERPFFGDNLISIEKSGQQTFPDGATVKFKCSPGYVTVERSASRSITCNGTQWSELQLQCQKKTCGNPGEILYGKYLYQPTDSIVFGAVITAECDAGYQLLGPKTRSCRENGWDTRPPVCEAGKCTKPLDITSGVFEPEKEFYEYEEGVTYSCNSGFHLFGQPVLSCSSDGTFQPALPQCLSVTCEKLDIPYASKTEGKSPPYKYRQFVRYVCNKGYKMEGSGFLTCTENGWDPNPPQCNVITCTNPPHIANGLFNPRKEIYEYEETVTYSCNEYFRLSEASSISCTLDGTFEPLLSQCLVIPGGFVNASSKMYKYNAQVQISCNKNYKIEESDILTCKEHGWSPSFLHCIKITCDEPNISNAFIAGGKASSYKYKSSIQVQCYTGYKMEGFGLLTCGKNGWNSTLLKCSPVTCSPPPRINNGHFKHLKEVYKYRQTVTFSCDEGYTLDGASEISCTENGRFQYSPQCVEVTCDKPNIINGSIIGGELAVYKFKSSILVHCNSGYSMTGSDHLTCKENGWDPSPPHCHLDYWIWIILSVTLAVLSVVVVVACCLKKNKLPEFISPKKKSDDVLKSDDCVLVSVPSSTFQAEEILLKNVN